MSVIGLAKNSIYDQLNSFTLGNVPASIVNSQQEPVNIMKINENRLDQVNRINKSLFRDGNPMPNSMKTETVTEIPSSYKNVFIPTKGQVWALQAGNLLRTSGSGSNSFQISYYDGSTYTGATYITTSSDNYIISGDDNFYLPYHVDNNVYFEVKQAAGTAVYNLQLVFTRVR